MAKPRFNLSKMTLTELVQLRDEIETAVNGRIGIERKELESKIAQLSELERAPLKNGRGADRPIGVDNHKPHPLKGRRVESKYRGPNGEKWAGRGLAPRWLTDLEKKGKKRQQFLIAK